MSDLPQAAIVAAAAAIGSAQNANDGPAEHWEARHLATVALEAAAPHIAAAEITAERERCRRLVHEHLVRVCATRGAASAAAAAVRAIHSELARTPEGES